LGVEVDDALEIAEQTEGYERAMVAAEKAVALAPQQAEGYSARDGLRYDYAWDWAGAQAGPEQNS